MVYRAENSCGIKWRQRTIRIKKSEYQIDWAYEKLECGYYVVAVKHSGLVGLSYCAPDDALPHWNPEKSIELAFARRRIRDDIKFITYDNTSISHFVALEYEVINGFVPHAVIREVQKCISTVTVGVL